MAIEIRVEAENLYREHAAKIYRFCLWRMNSHQDAEDAATEVFVKVLRGKAKGVEPARLLGWLLKVADNECKLIYRKRQRRGEVDIGQTEETAYRDVRPWISPHLCAAVNRLKPVAKRVMFLRAVEDLRFSEIAAVLNISEGAVKMVFYRATKKLANSLGGRGEDHD